MPDDEIGYHEDPKNNNGIIRARTLGQIRSWELPRTTKGLERLNEELGKVEFPGLYILLEGKKKTYIGEAKNVYKRLQTHLTNPEDKIKDWDRVLIINDGRPATQSDLNDAVVRKALELYLIKLFKANKYSVVAQGEPQKLNTSQKFLYDTLKNELDFFLLKKNLITKRLEERGKRRSLETSLKELLRIGD
jgi:predicted GIY-YIG superfamily endonuclease